MNLSYIMLMIFSVDFATSVCIVNDNACMNETTIATRDNIVHLIDCPSSMKEVEVCGQLIAKDARGSSNELKYSVAFAACMNYAQSIYSYALKVVSCQQVARAATSLNQSLDIITLCIWVWSTDSGRPNVKHLADYCSRFDPE